MKAHLGVRRRVAAKLGQQVCSDVLHSICATGAEGCVRGATGTRQAQKRLANAGLGAGSARPSASGWLVLLAGRAGADFSEPRSFFAQLLVALPSLGQLPKALASDWAQCTHRLHSVVGGIHGNTKAGVSFGVGFRKKWVRTCSAREGRSRRPRLAARARRRFSLG